MKISKDEEGFSIGTPEPLRNARRAARPLLFDTGIPEAPVSVWGTCFFVARRNQVFVITAGHLVGNQHQSVVNVTASNYGGSRVGISRGYRYVSGDPGWEYDVIVYKADLSEVPAAAQRLTRAFELDSDGSWNWHPTAHTAQILVMGHPLERNEVDYSAATVMTSQVLMAGRYLGPSATQPTIHRVEVDNSIAIENFRGMSGGPVISLERRIAMPAAMRFCGIAVWGTAASSSIHFLEARCVVELIDKAAGGDAGPI